MVKRIVKKILKRLFGIKSVSQSYWKRKKISLLTPQETIRTLEPYRIRTVPSSVVHLPGVADENNPHRMLYKPYTYRSGEVYVWQRHFTDGYVSKNGSVVIDKKVLCTDWDHRGFEHEFWKLDKRPETMVGTVISLLSHHQDASEFSSLTGYYDFVLLVAAKLSRIKDAIGEEITRDMVITYHSFGGAYEKEYLELLGFNPDNFIDSRKYKISAKRLITGNMTSWKPNAYEVQSLKRNIESRLNITETTHSAGNRIYISRKGRRSVENEDELIELLKEFDFIVIEDNPRTVTEQIEIYRNASFIIGPHGASFSNIIWCREGTFLYELFPQSWKPDYFHYLARINNMKYAAFLDDTQPDVGSETFEALCQNLYISLPKLKESLSKLLPN